MSKLKNGLVALVLGAQVAIGCDCTNIQPAYRQDTFVRKLDERAALEDIAKGVHCIRNTVEYKNIQTGEIQRMQGYGTGFAMQYVDGRTYIVTNAHVVQAPSVVLARTSDGIQLYKYHDQKVTLVDNASDTNTLDDIDAIPVSSDEDKDLALLEVHDKLHVSKQYSRMPVNSRVGDTVYIIGYPAARFKARTKGNTIMNRAIIGRDKVDILDITMTFGNSGSPYFLRDDRGRLFFGGVVNAMTPYPGSKATMFGRGIANTEVYDFLKNNKKVMEGWE